MKTLALKAVVTGPDGFYYRHENEWHNISGDAEKFFSGYLQESVRIVNQRGGKFDGNMTATLSCVIDGAPQPDLVATGVSHDEVVQFERHAQKFGDRLLQMGEQHARQKKAAPAQSTAGQSGKGGAQGGEAGN